MCSLYTCTQVNINARYLRFTISSGYDDFATVNRSASVILYCPLLMQACIQLDGFVERVSVVGEAAADDTGMSSVTASEKVDVPPGGLRRATTPSDYNETA
jgi:hypothetical protein